MSTEAWLFMGVNGCSIEPARSLARETGKSEDGHDALANDLAKVVT